MGIVDDIGKVDVQVVQGKCRLSNRLVSDVLQTFADSELGSRHDGLLCIASSILAYETRTKRTSLMAAAESGSLDAVALLLQAGHKAGAELNARNIKGQTALSLAAANGNEGVARRLLEENGVQVDLQDLGGRTALWWAAANGHSEVVRLLVKNGGADFKQPDHDGRTPMIAATENWHDTVVRTLFALGQRQVFRTSQRGVGLQNPKQEKKANDFFKNYCEFVHRQRQSLREESRNGHRAGNLKVALLSTGLALDTVPPHLSNWLDVQEELPSGKNFIDGDDTNDSDGRGTDLVDILIKICPDIDLFIAKVAFGPLRTAHSASIVAKAISWCAAEYGADIIIIPLGFPTSEPEVEAAIKHTLEGERPPVFMAAVGPGQMRTYPASRQHIIGIHAVDGEGRDIGISPPPLKDDDNFSTLGSGIQLGLEGKIRLQHGSLYALAVAAGITAYILGYVQQVATLTEEDRRWLRSSDGVRELLRLVSTKQHGYRFIAPWEVWGRDVKAEEIGNLVEAIVRRRKKA